MSFVIVHHRMQSFLWPSTPFYRCLQSFLTVTAVFYRLLLSLTVVYNRFVTATNVYYRLQSFVLIKLAYTRKYFPLSIIPVYLSLQSLVTVTVVFNRLLYSLAVVYNLFLTATKLYYPTTVVCGHYTCL